MYPEYLEYRPEYGYGPDTPEQAPAKGTPKRDQAERGIGGGNEYKDHDVIQLAHTGRAFLTQGQPVIQGADRIQQDHAGAKDRECGEMPGLDGIGCLYKEHNKPHACEQGSDKMREPVNGFPESLYYMHTL